MSLCCDVRIMAAGDDDGDGGGGTKYRIGLNETALVSERTAAAFDRVDCFCVCAG